MSSAYRLKTKGLTVNVRKEGEGPPLLFLGGSNSDLSLKTPVFESVLPEYFTVVTADHRGLGTTDAPLGEWSMQHYAQDSIDLLDALGWEQVDVLGESFGAMIAMHLAAQAPERVRRMALAAGSAGGAGGSSHPIHEFLEIDDIYSRTQAALEVLDTRFKILKETKPDEAENLIRARIISDQVFYQSHNNAEGYPRLLAARSFHDAWQLLPDISIPTLVLSGQYDGQAPPERARMITKALINATLHNVQGSHSHCFATTETVEIILDNWIS